MFKKIIFHRSIQLIVHCLFWAIVLFFYTSFFGYDSPDFDYVLAFSLFLMPITIATTYVFIYKLIPDYLFAKRLFLFVLYSIYTLIVSSYLILVSVFFGLVYLSNFKYTHMAPISRSILFVCTGVYLVVIVVSAFKLLKLNLEHSKKSKKLETKILETQLKLREQELKYLKMQIHPHFLFNTLNTLYGFALMKADETPEMILKLSSLLDYLLYKVDQPFVHLIDDINHIKDYIELEKMRFNETLNIEFTTDNVSKDLKIAPMLLIPFVENSFKHGALKARQLTIKIDLRCENQVLYFYIENTQTKIETTNKGIGLENIKKRLDLVYKDNYILTIENKNDTFKINLQLKLN